MFIINNEKVIAEVMAMTPSSYSYDCVSGSRNEFTAVTAVMADGSKIKLDSADEAEYANEHTPTTRTTAQPVARQVAELGEVKSLIIRTGCYSDFGSDEEWEVSETDFDNGLPWIGNGQEYEIYVPLAPLNWTKVRSRLEDRLRKDTKTVRQCAGLLEIDLS